MRTVVLLAIALVASPAAAQTPEPQAPAVRVNWNEHPTLVLGPARLSLRAAVRSDSRRSDAPLADNGDGGLDLPRRRLGFEGSLGGRVEFQVEREIGDADPWRDVYVNVRPARQLQVQAGKFKLPFGLEENVSSTNLDFAYRSLVSRALTPGRDRGVMVHGRVLDRLLRYEVGRFARDGANASSRSGERVSSRVTEVARVLATPFRKRDSFAEDFQVGLAFAEGRIDGDGPSGIRGETTMGRPFFSSVYPVQGQRRRVGFETRWRPGPFSVQAEYVRLTDERLGESVDDADLSPIRSTGWYASGTWAVTGERKADGLAESRRAIGRGGVGAIELAVRIERLVFNSAARGETPSLSPRADVIVGNGIDALTVGTNWYLNRWVKLQLNVIRETVADPAQGPMPSQPTFWSRIVRLHFSL